MSLISPNVTNFTTSRSKTVIALMELVEKKNIKKKMLVQIYEIIYKIYLKMCLNDF